MALSNLADWNQTKASPENGSSCGSACGAEKPAACGSACGAGGK